MLRRVDNRRRGREGKEEESRRKWMKEQVEKGRPGDGHEKRQEQERGKRLWRERTVWCSAVCLLHGMGGAGRLTYHSIIKKKKIPKG